MSDPARPVISVVGAAEATPAEAEAARQVGRLLAEAGAVVVSGGRGGVMEAVSRGAAEAGGITVGVLPGPDPHSGNAYLTVSLGTGLGSARNAVVALAGEAMIAIGGGYGTLSEIALALKAGRRVIGLHTWEARDAKGSSASIQRASTPEEAVRLALQAHLEGRRTESHGS